MTNPANLLERVVDEHLRLHPHDPHEHPLPALPGSILEPPRVVGWFSMRDYYDKTTAENWEPCVVQFVARINGEQLVTLRGI
ncbi:MAG TPA: hypothetical protein VMV92_20705 [Streptosporangiaceae bacterium]|nr:hypothetical protein [Streptosporangiaceae bacterium]